MKKKGSFGLFIMWLFAGIITLIVGPTRHTYGLIWTLLLLHYLIEAFVGDYFTGYNEAINICVDVIDTKINELKEKKEQ